MGNTRWLPYRRCMMALNSDSLPAAELLMPLTLLDPQNFSELVEACRKHIRVWVEADTDLTHDLVTTFIGIESEADEVARQSGGRRKNEAHFYDWYHPYFIVACDDIRQAFSGCCRVQTGHV